jgi:hypothetical protein
MLTREEIEARKEHLRSHPEVKKLCKLLGVTMERFLEDIEKQHESCVLYDSTTDEQRERTKQEVLAAAKEAFREERESMDLKACRKDGFIGEPQADREDRSRTLVGVES